jgi:putative heme-binding domain-containing protein
LLLADNIEGQSRGVAEQEPVRKVSRTALLDPQTRAQGITLAAACRDGRNNELLKSIAIDEKLSEEERVAAVSALGDAQEPDIAFLDQLVEATEGKPTSTATANAALRTIARIRDMRKKLDGVVGARSFPLGLRREALRVLAEQQDGGERMIALARDGKLPEDLKTEAVTLLLAHRDRRIREQAAQVLPMPKIADGRALPPLWQLLRRQGNPENGRSVFFRSSQSSCASCHRVQGQGQWVGPDLSTIGTKYGKDELLKSIINPSAAIGYSFRTLVLALADGRAVSGLLVEETPQRLVLKTADGQRVTIRPGDVEDRKFSEVSLMPEGLAQTMTDQEIVDLLAFMETLRKPVSIVGQYQVIGPLSENSGEKSIDPAAKIDLGTTVRGPGQEALAWRRVDASAEGIADLSALLAGKPGSVAYAFTPITSPSAQAARLVVESPGELTAWLNGEPTIKSRSASAPSDSRQAEIRLPKGSSTLLIRIRGGNRASDQSSLLTTIVSAEPVSFASGSASLSAR